MSIESPATQYASVGDDSVAFQVFGEGEMTILMVPTWITHVEAMWEIPSIARSLERFGSFARVIVYDHLGVGMSDPVATDTPRTLENRLDEIGAVLDAADCGRATMLGFGPGSPVAILAAASLTDRVTSLVVANGSARWPEDDRYPGLTLDQVESIQASIFGWWGKPAETTTPAERIATERWARYQRQAASPGVVRAMIPLAMRSDVRAVLSSVRVPTAILVSPADETSGRGIMFLAPLMDQGKYLAEHIPNAQFHVVERDDPRSPPDLEVFSGAIREFLTGVVDTPEASRVLATVLFSDIVSSTERAATAGDRRWKELLDDHNQMVRRQLARFQGREIKTLGDGFLATFDGPARAIRCASAICEGARRYDLEVRVGLHTGEIELRGDDVGGMAVNIAARVSAKAGASEVLVSRTVCDLVVGSGLKFDDRGSHTLKGVPGEWQLFAVVNP